MITNFCRRRYAVSFCVNEICIRRIYERLGSPWWFQPQHPHKKRLCVRIEISQSWLLYSTFNSTFRECDATIINNSYAYESVSMDAMKDWFSEMQKELHVLGPLLPPGYGTETQNSEAGSSVDIETFLEEMLVQHGKKSVYFVRWLSSFRIQVLIK